MRCVITISTVLVGLSILVPVSGVSGQQGADGALTVVEGTVLDEFVGTPIEEAVVTIEETGDRVETDAEGRFTISVPEGPTTLRVTKPAYSTVVERIEAAHAEAGRYEILLPRVDALLQGIVAEANASSNRSAPGRTTRGNRGVRTSVLDVLANDVPGVTVSRGLGEVGKGTGIRLRGVKNLSGDDSPQIYLDGVRVGISGNADGPSTGSVRGILESIPAADIDQIRVLSGPAATAGFMGAANGVILIETRRGVDPDADGQGGYEG